MTRPIGIDLFAGAGGMSLGFEQAGFDIAACVEIDPIHCAVHHYNFQYSTPICASVIDLSGDEIRARAELGDRKIDVVFGGAPCQGFSSIGKRILSDPRNALVFHFVRLVRQLEPKYCVFENVRGLTFGTHKQFLVELVAELHDIGYEVRLPYEVLNAAEFGVPQERRRLFLLAARSGETLPEYPTIGSTRRVTVGDAISDLPDADSFSELLYSDTVRTSWKTKARYAKILRGLQVDPSDYSHPRSFSASVLTSSNRTEHTQLSQDRFAQTPNGGTEPVSRFRKLDPNGFCNTLRAGTDSARGAFTSPRPIHPTLPRVITVREAARLHSYPDWFRFHVTKWHGFRQIGNSVPPLLARAVAAELMKAMKQKPERPTATSELGPEELLTLDMRQAAEKFGIDVPIAQRVRGEGLIKIKRAQERARKDGAETLLQAKSQALAD